MLRKIEMKHMGKSDQGWLRSIFHFSFADYYNVNNMNFGVLRVLNDDLVDVGEGFEPHPHRDMEIISYIVNGELTHGDSMGNKRTLSRGDVQYMSAGTGVFHSEHNHGNETLRFLQIWILPDKKGHKPNYGDYIFDWNVRKDRWFKLVSSQKGDAPIKINQDVNIHVLELTKGNETVFQVDNNRQAYLVQIEGQSTINNIQLKEKDAMEVVEDTITIKAETTSNFLLIEMKKQ